jgi:glutamate/tyrosine decarboxylase-like PLP-dependent enzyme
MQAYGDAGYEARLDHAMHLAQYLETKILEDGNAFLLVHPRSFTNVCFYWVPPCMRPFHLDRATQSELADMGKVGKLITCMLLITRQNAVLIWHFPVQILFCVKA